MNGRIEGKVIKYHACANCLTLFSRLNSSLSYQSQFLGIGDYMAFDLKKKTSHANHIVSPEKLLLKAFVHSLSITDLFYNSHHAF